MNSKNQELKLTKKDLGVRVDKLLVAYVKKFYSDNDKYLHILARDYVSSLVVDVLRVNDQEVKSSYKIREGDTVVIDMVLFEMRLVQKLEDIENLSKIIPEKGDLDIIFENDDYIVINKAHGVVVHPGYNNSTGTVANFLRGYLEEKGEFDGTMDRAGIVHRLDKDVAGLMLLAKNRKTQMYLKKQFEEHKVLKLYRAKASKVQDTAFVNEVESLRHLNDKFDDIGAVMKSVSASFSEETENSVGTWMGLKGYVGRDKRNRLRMEFTKDVRTKAAPGKFAESLVMPIRDDEFLIRIKTGRMHQIRATLRYLGFVINGDDLYKSGRSNSAGKIQLVSSLLSFVDMDGKKVEWLLE